MALFLVIAACGGGEPPATSDGGPEDADAGATPPEVAPAELPTAPSFRVDGACPAGWIPVDLGEALICAPFGGDDPRRCDAHALHVPSEAACRPAGRACEDPPAPDGVVVHVRAGASGGDGSESAPFGELDVALAAAASGSALVLAPGRYETDGLVLDRPLRLYGACAAETSVVARAGDAPGAIVVTSAAVVLDGISVTGPEHGIIVREGGEASLRGVVVLDVPGTGLWVAGRVEAEELVTRMLEPGIAGELDVGVLVHTTGHLSLRRAELRGHDVAAIGVFGGELELEDVVIGAQSHPAGALRGHGVEVAGGGRARARRLFVSATNDAGILVEHEGSSLELEDTLVGDVKGASIGVTVLPGATCSMRRVVVGAITNLGVDVAGGRLRAEDLFVANADDAWHEFGVVARGEGAHLELSRTVVHQGLRVGVQLHLGASGRLEDTRVVGVEGRPTPLRPEDHAFGLVAYEAELEFARVRVEGCDGYGVMALLADVRGTDLTTYYTHAHPETLFGAGLQAERSRVSLERVHLDQSQTGGLFAFNDDTSIELRDVVISNSYRSGCLDEVDRCASFVGGIGLGVYDGAQVVLERFRLEGNELIGAQVARGLDEHEEPNEAVGDLELRGGVVTRSLVGVNVAAEGYDLRKVSAQVWFSENGRDIETSVLPTPPPLER